jgi:hypothetical protein
MPIRSPRKKKSTSTKVAELVFAVPQVVAHRVTRMALAGPVLSKHDRREFNLMVAEKNIAFAQAWQEMFKQSVRANRALVPTFMRSIWSPSAASKGSAGKAIAQMQNAALGVFGRGLAPFHQKAVANAKRLARAKLR